MKLSKVLRLGLCIGTLAITPNLTAQLPPRPTKIDQDGSPRPELVVAERRVDIGSVLEGDVVTVSWHLENRGKADLIIERARPSCGCTIVALTDEQKRIPPGQSMVFKAQFDSRSRNGAQLKTITIFSNDPVEPQMPIAFTANVEYLYEVRPPQTFNLRAVRRGQKPRRALQILPGQGRGKLTILSVDFPPSAPLTHEIEKYTARDDRTGYRIWFIPNEDAALGNLMTSATIKLEVDGKIKERMVDIRSEIVGALASTPKIVNTTRQKSTRGKSLAPVRIMATNDMPFKILSASAGPLIDVVCEPASGNRAGSQYSCGLTIRSDASPGPFGALLEVYTDSLDQPIVEVPIFGIVTAPIEIDPRMILLVQDGTPKGTARRIKLQASTRDTMEILSISCDNAAVAVELDLSKGHAHLLHLGVRLVGTLAPGVHETTIDVTTNIIGAEELRIPVRIEVPAK